MAMLKVGLFIISLILTDTSAEDTPKVCPPEVSSCPSGMRLDRKYVQGCFDTVCVPDSCPYFKCVPCEYGYELNDDGCVGCSCKSPPADVPQNQCGQKVTSCASNMRMDCKYVMGCFDCDCVPENCPMVDCAVSCDYGYKIIEETGCRGCECKSGDVPQNQCGQKVTSCAANMTIDCKYVMDCFDCDCVPENCPMVNCVPCDYGYKIIEETGCRGCECKLGAASAVFFPTVAVKIMPVLVLFLSTVLQ